MAPMSTGDPGNAPPWYFSTASAAVIRPSFLAPILTQTVALEVGPLARNTSSRLMTIFTGLPALRESARATGSMKTVVLPPNPPPISEAVTRSLDTSMPRSVAQTLRTA